MAIPVYNFGITVRYPIGHAQQGLPYSGCQNVQIKKGDLTIGLFEVGVSAFYFSANVPAGRYDLFVNAVSTGQSFGVGEGELAGLGFDNDKSLFSGISTLGWRTAPGLTWDSILGKPSQFPPSAHSNHVVSDVYGLADILASKSAVGHAHLMTDVTGLSAALALKIDVAQKGVALGVPELDANGKVPVSQLPGFLDDIREYVNLAGFPVSGESGVIYVALDSLRLYRWSGSTYSEISASLALGETPSTAYRGDRGKTAYDHSQATGNPHNTAIGNITGLQSILDGKESLHGRTSITAAVDFRTVGIGTHKVSGGTMHANNPAGAYAWGTLQVSVTSTGNQLLIYAPHSASGKRGIYTDVCWDGTWRAWSFIPSEDYLLTAFASLSQTNEFAAVQKILGGVGIWESFGDTYPTIGIASQMEPLAPGIGAGPVGGDGEFDTYLTRPSAGLWYTPGDFSVHGELNCDSYFRCGTGATGWWFADSGGAANIWNAGVVASQYNYAFRAGTTSTIINGSASSRMRVNAVDRLFCDSTGVSIQPESAVRLRVTDTVADLSALLRMTQGYQTNYGDAAPSKGWIMQAYAGAGNGAALYNAGVVGGPSGLNYALYTSAASTWLNAVTTVGISIGDSPKINVEADRTKFLTPWVFYDGSVGLYPKAGVTADAAGGGESGWFLGSGSALADCSIYRKAANVLATGDSFEFGAEVVINSRLSLSNKQNITTQAGTVDNYATHVSYGYTGTGTGTLNFPGRADDHPGRTFMLRVPSSVVTTTININTISGAYWNGMWYSNTIGANLSQVKNRMFLVSSDGLHWAIIGA